MSGRKKPLASPIVTIDPGVQEPLCQERRSVCTDGILKVHAEKMAELQRAQKATDQKVTACLIFAIVTLVAVLARTI